MNFQLRIFLFFLVLTIFSCSEKSDPRAKTLNEIKFSVEGKWQVVNSTYLPFRHISFCDSLYKKSVFEFTEEKKLNVYKLYNGILCSERQTYNVSSDRITILEHDMVFYYYIKKLTSDSLVFSIKTSLNYIYRDNKLNDQERQKLINDGIEITLVKLNNELKTRTAENISLNYFVDSAKGEYDCFVKKIEYSKNGTSIIVDFVKYLIGKEAHRASIDEGNYEIDNGDTITDITNDYYISNQNSKLRRFTLNSHSQIQYYDWENDGELKSKSISQFVKKFNEIDEIYPLFEIIYENGSIISLKEIFMP